MDKADQLIKKIDDELLYLYEASTKNQEYYHFDFKSALKLLNVEILRLGSKEYYQMRASQYVSVFNDLCNTIVSVIFTRFLSFDTIDNILVIEEQERRYDELDDVSIYEKYNISGDSIIKYSNLKYPTVFKESRKICKFDKIISKCKSVSYKKNDSDFYANSFGYQLEKQFNSNEKFDDYFNIDSYLITKHKTTFEKYIHDLIEIRALESEFVEHIEIENNAKEKADKPIKELDVKKESIINELIPKFILVQQKKYLMELFEINTISAPINWMGTHNELVNSVNNWYDAEIIKFPSNSGSKDFILKYFKIKGKSINKGTLDNACTVCGIRYSNT